MVFAKYRLSWPYDKRGTPLKDVKKKKNRC